MLKQQVLHQQLHFVVYFATIEYYNPYIASTGQVRECQRSPKQKLCTVSYLWLCPTELLEGKLKI